MTKNINEIKECKHFKSTLGTQCMFHQQILILDKGTSMHFSTKSNNSVFAWHGGKIQMRVPSYSALH